MNTLFFTAPTVRRVRWSGSLLLALSLHLGALFWLGYRAQTSAQQAPPPAMMLLLAEQVQSTPNPQQVPLGPQQTLSAPERASAEPEQGATPLPVVEAAAQGTLAIATKVQSKVPAKSEKMRKVAKPQPEPPPQEVMPAQTPPAPSTSAPLAGRDAQVAAAYTSDAAQMQRGVADWSSRVLAHLARYKRYPPQAARQRLQGVTQIRVTLDRSGNVLSVMLQGGSGVAVLDQESVALPQRAQPLPAPPVEVMGTKAQFTLTIPISFDLREFQR